MTIPKSQNSQGRKRDNYFIIVLGFCWYQTKAQTSLFIFARIFSEEAHLFAFLATVGAFFCFLLWEVHRAKDGKGR
jgi:hypothetical protein